MLADLKGLESATQKSSDDLRWQLKNAEGMVTHLRGQIAAMEKDCKHDWTEPIYDPVIRAGYMQTDSLSPYYREVWVPEFRRDLWRRTCKTCGCVSETTVSKPQPAQKVPVFP